MRKPRSDSQIKTLPEDQQAEIYARLNRKGGSYEKVVQWMFDELDIRTSVGALQSWYSWYALKQRVHAESSFVESLLEHMNADGALGGMSQVQMADFGNALFMARAAREEDPKTWAMVLKLVNQREMLNLDARRITLLEQKAQAMDNVKASTKGKALADMSEEERQEVLRMVDQSLKLL